MFSDGGPKCCGFTEATSLAEVCAKGSLSCSLGIINRVGREKNLDGLRLGYILASSFSRSKVVGLSFSNSVK